MGVATGVLIAGGIAAAAGATTSAIGASKAKNARDAATSQADQLQQQLEAMEASRPAFKNPYENLTNQFENLNNPYANLTVSTEAAKIQAEEADIALANSLDMMQEQGMGAAGATALAQMALKSKRGIASSINAQETQNKKMAAQGQANVDKLKAEGAQKLDMMRAKGDEMEQRDAISWHEKKLDRTAGLIDNARQNAADADAARNAAIMGIGTSIANGAGIIAGGFGTGGSTPTPPPTTSDRRLKKNIKLIDESSSGLKIYTFEYINKEGVYKGVMSDEVPSNVVIVDEDGFDMVDYSKIDVKFEKVK